MGRGHRGVRASTSRESVRSNYSLWPCRGVLSDIRYSSDARARRLRPAETMKPSRTLTPTEPKLVSVTDTQVTAVVPPPSEGDGFPLANEPAEPVKKSDLDAVAELADAHDQILKEI